METKFITDAKGKKTDAIIPIKDYERLLEISEEYEELQINDKGFSEEMKRRIHDLESGTVKGYSWNEVKVNAKNFTKKSK